MMVVTLTQEPQFVQCDSDSAKTPRVDGHYSFLKLIIETNCYGLQWLNRCRIKFFRKFSLIWVSLFLFPIFWREKSLSIFKINSICRITSNYIIFLLHQSEVTQKENAFIGKACENFSLKITVFLVTCVGSVQCVLVTVTIVEFKGAPLSRYHVKSRYIPRLRITEKYEYLLNRWNE
jgi:hypothetical protein